MATQIKLRRDTAANWLLEDPILGAGEPGFELVTGKLKIGDGTSLWSALDYIVAEPDGSIDLGAVDKNLLPATDNAYDLGSPAKRWRHVYAADGSVYIGDIKLSNSAGTLLVQQVTNAGEITEAPVASPGVVTTDRIINGAHSFSINASGALQLDGAPYIGSGTGLPENTLGYLYNDGTGTLTWASGAGGGSGNTDRLTNGANEVILEDNGSLTLPTNSTITDPATTSNLPGGYAININGQRGFGNWSTDASGGWGTSVYITAGLGGESNTDGAGGEGGEIWIKTGDGQAGNNGGHLSLIAGDAQWHSGTNNVHGGHVNITAGNATNSTNTFGYGGNVVINAGTGSLPGQHGNVEIHTNNNTWVFDQEGPFTNNLSFTRTTAPNLNGSTPTVVWTSYGNRISGAKLQIQVEAEEGGDATGWHSQVCEAVIASRGYANATNGFGEPVMTVYAVTHTSVAPLVEFTVRRDPTTHFIEVVATQTATAATPSNAQLRIYSVETATRD